ncbi:MAG: phytanoyl-CoA dioxygenase family protein [Thermoleophilaceae bacterium]
MRAAAPASATAKPSVATLRDDGFAVFEGFLPPSAVETVRAEVERALAQPLPPACERPHNTLAPLGFADAPVTTILGSAPRRTAVARAAGGHDLRFVSAYASVKEPRSEALWWHQDWWCWDHPVSLRAEAPQVALLCYLSDTSASAGALRVLPGSHRWSVPLHAALPEAHASGAAGVAADHPAMSDHDGQATLALRAGDAVMLDYRLLHGTHPNRGHDRRACVLLSFAPSWRTLPDDVRAHLIRHPALPSAADRGALPGWADELLPAYDGVPRDLPLNRTAPSEFAVR